MAPHLQILQSVSPKNKGILLYRHNTIIMLNNLIRDVTIFSRVYIQIFSIISLLSFEAVLFCFVFSFSFLIRYPVKDPRLHLVVVSLRVFLI